MIAEARTEATTTHHETIDWQALGAGLKTIRYRSLRYAFDWTVALFLMVALAPVLLVVAMAIKLDSPGPVFFRQVRAGRLAKPFTIVKFRTMRTSAPATSLKVSDRDPNITRIGHLLRRTGIDEIPQLFNVLRGEMVLIGPRPEQMPLLGLYETWQHERHLVKPGITGWWQIHHRDSVPMHLNVDKDVHYVRHMGLRLDALIVLGTLKVLASPLLSRRRADARVVLRLHEVRDDVLDVAAITAVDEAATPMLRPSTSGSAPT